jgi:2-polyprenyl-3-methyl-5-hydroxy-6-metoxy-1,4-benzoquinol methylase
MSGRVHLSPRIYSALQHFVHQGHTATFERIVDLLALQPGDSVLEIGCGTGILAHHFVRRGFDYRGVDFDAQRIAVAQRENPAAHFLVADALRLDQAPLPPFRHVFFHGVLHHIADADCSALLKHILSLRPDMMLAVSEPFMPSPWWTNPLGALGAQLDEGEYVRTLPAWHALFGNYLETGTTRSLMPRYPVGFIDALLRPRT